jgi:hypothetical protein
MKKLIIAVAVLVIGAAVLPGCKGEVDVDDMTNVPQPR